MAKVNTTVSLDSDVKQKSQVLLADMGLDLSTAFNIFLRQLLYEQAIPFSISRGPNPETVTAIKEAEEFRAYPLIYKRYATFADAVADIEAEEDEDA